MPPLRCSARSEATAARAGFSEDRCRWRGRLVTGPWTQLWEPIEVTVMQDPGARACIRTLSFRCLQAELLRALCTGDFVIQGALHRIGHGTELQSVVTVAAVRVLRQALPLFPEGGSGGPVPASIRTPLRGGVRPGPGTFLFVGWSHFGEAWLGCAPRFQEFSRAYAAARTNHLCPFGVAPD